MSLFGNVWLYSAVAFVLGVLLTWLFWVLPLQKRLRAMRREAAALRSAAVAQRDDEVKERHTGAGTVVAAGGAGLAAVGIGGLFAESRAHDRSLLDGDAIHDDEDPNHSGEDVPESADAQDGADVHETVHERGLASASDPHNGSWETSVFAPITDHPELDDRDAREGRVFDREEPEPVDGAGGDHPSWNPSRLGEPAVGEPAVGEPAVGERRDEEPGSDEHEGHAEPESQVTQDLPLADPTTQMFTPVVGERADPAAHEDDLPHAQPEFDAHYGRDGYPAQEQQSADAGTAGSDNETSYFAFLEQQRDAATAPGLPSAAGELTEAEVASGQVHEPPNGAQSVEPQVEHKDEAGEEQGYEYQPDRMEPVPVTLPKRVSKRRGSQISAAASRPLQDDSQPTGRRAEETRSLFEPVVASELPMEEDLPDPRRANTQYLPPVAEPAGSDVPIGPFGPGSALPRPDGSAPSPEFQVKARTSSMVFHTENSPFFARLLPQIWFRSPEEAKRAGFTSWERPKD
ncbi:MAG: hypothetical protein ACRDRN_11495 [Sciscionella sp.]